MNFQINEQEAEKMIDLIVNAGPGISEELSDKFCRYQERALDITMLFALSMMAVLTVMLMVWSASDMLYVMGSIPLVILTVNKIVKKVLLYRYFRELEKEHFKGFA